MSDPYLSPTEKAHTELRGVLRICGELRTDRDRLAAENVRLREALPGPVFLRWLADNLEDAGFLGSQNWVPMLRSQARLIESLTSAGPPQDDVALDISMRHPDPPPERRCTTFWSRYRNLEHYGHRDCADPACPEHGTAHDPA